ncbi:MAG TPA: YtxH domain-containing protein [Gemmatimonadales bacterium]
MASDREDELELEDELDDDLEDELEEEMEGSRGSLRGFAIGLLVGAVMGAGAALLVAPESGTVTRRRLSRRFRDLKDDAADQLGEIRDDASRGLRRQRRKIKRRLSSS